MVAIPDFRSVPAPSGANANTNANVNAMAGRCDGRRLLRGVSFRRSGTRDSAFITPQSALGVYIFLMFLAVFFCQ